MTIARVAACELTLFLRHNLKWFPLFSLASIWRLFSIQHNFRFILLSIISKIRELSPAALHTMCHVVLICSKRKEKECSPNGLFEIATLLLICRSEVLRWPPTLQSSCCWCLLYSLCLSLSLLSLFWVLRHCMLKIRNFDRFVIDCWLIC